MLTTMNFLIGRISHVLFHILATNSLGSCVDIRFSENSVFVLSRAGRRSLQCDIAVAHAMDFRIACCIIDTYSTMYKSIEVAEKTKKDNANKHITWEREDSENPERGL